MSGKQKRGKMIILSSILLAALAAAFVIVRLPSFGRLPQGERLERIRQSHSSSSDCRASGVCPKANGSNASGSRRTTATAGSAIKKPVR